MNVKTTTFVLILLLALTSSTASAFTFYRYVEFCYGMGSIMKVNLLLRGDAVNVDSNGNVIVGQNKGNDECEGDEYEFGKGGSGKITGEWSFDGGIIDSPPVVFVNPEKFEKWVNAVGTACTDFDVDTVESCPDDFPVYQLMGVYVNVICTQVDEVEGENVYYDEESESHRLKVQIGDNEVGINSKVKCAGYMEMGTIKGSTLRYGAFMPRDGRFGPLFEVNVQTVSMNVKGKDCGRLVV